MASSRSASSFRRPVGRHRRPSRATVVIPGGVTGGLLLATAATGIATAGPAAANTSGGAAASASSDSAASSSSTASSASTASRTSSDLPAYPYLLSRGDTGRYVTMVQAELGGIATDGIFGPVTEDAVMEFQRSHGLVVDGLVGPNTWAALRASGSGTGGSSSVDVQQVSYSSSAAASGAAARALDIALAQVNDPYVYGAEGPDAFDCSGLVNYAYARAGVNLPRTTSQLINAGTRISRAQLRPGDLVFTSDHHVGLYVGNGRMVSARNSEDDLGVHPIWQFYAGVRV